MTRSAIIKRLLLLAVLLCVVGCYGFSASPSAIYRELYHSLPMWASAWLPLPASPERYAVATGNWSSVNTWSDTSGGAPGATVPDSTTNVFIGTGMASAPTITVDATASCADLTFAAAADASKPTLARSAGNLNVYGSLVLVSGMGAFGSSGGNLTFAATSGTKQITTNGVIVRWTTVFNGSGGIFQLQDAYECGSTMGFVLTAGTFDANSQTVLLRGTSHTISGAFTGTSSFYNLTRTGTATKTDGLALESSIVVTGTLAANGNSAINRLLIYSSAKGTARTITLTNPPVFTNIDVQDMTAAGAAGAWDLSAISGGSGNCGGNTGITFSTPATYYYHQATAGADNFSTVGKWFTQTNAGGSAATQILPQDTLNFDANSFDAAGATVTQDMPRIGSVNWTGATNSPTWTTSTAASVFGSITLISGMTLTASTQAYTFEGRGANTLTSAGKTWAKIINLNAPGGTLTISDALTNSNYIGHYSGTLNTNGQTITSLYYDAGDFALVGSPPILTLGASSYVVTGSSTSWYAAASQTVNAGTSTITMTNTGAVVFSGAGKTYNNLTFSPGAGAGGLTVTGTNTFTGTVTLDGSGAYTVTLPNVTTTVGAMTRSATTNVITLQRTGGSGSATLAYSKGGQISLPRMSISNVTATPANKWFAPVSTNGGNNNGIIFGMPASGRVIW